MKLASIFSVVHYQTLQCILWDNIHKVLGITSHTSSMLDALWTQSTTFIVSDVDYCNAILHRARTQVVHQLQIVMNAAAHMVTGCWNFQHITPVLSDVLYWLLGPQWIQFMIAFLAFNYVWGTCLAYFQHICVRRESFWPCRSPPCRMWCSGHVRNIDRTWQTKFLHCSPVIWNSPPEHLCSPSISKEVQFHCGFKTLLF